MEGAALIPHITTQKIPYTVNQKKCNSTVQRTWGNVYPGVRPHNLPRHHSVGDRDPLSGVLYSKIWEENITSLHMTIAREVCDTLSSHKNLDISF